MCMCACASHVQGRRGIKGVNREGGEGEEDEEDEFDELGKRVDTLEKQIVEVIDLNLKSAYLHVSGVCVHGHKLL